VWRWTADGNYSTRSAYNIQFQGSRCKFQADLIWKARAENKCKIHAWLLMHDKILTADNLQKRGWPHHEHCVLCNGPLETGLHLFCYAPSLKPSGARCYLGKTLMCNCPNKIPNAWPPGGRMWRAWCQSKNAEHLMECSFMLCGTCGRKGIGEFSKTNIKRRNRSPIWPRKILFRDVGPCVVRAKSTSA